MERYGLFVDTGDVESDVTLAVESREELLEKVSFFIDSGYPVCVQLLPDTEEK